MIAGEHRVSIASLMQANGLRDPYVIPGQHVGDPASLSTTAVPAPGQHAERNQADGRQHRHQPIGAATEGEVSDAGGLCRDGGSRCPPPTSA